MEYIAPEYNKKKFTCPYCNTLAEQKWDFEDFNYTSGYYQAVNYEYSGNIRISFSTCQSCEKPHIWVKNEMLVPRISNIPMPIEGMPENVEKIYNEARDVFPTSAKAAAALLRLALQHLCVELGGDGKNINTDIGKLVKEKGLPVQIQQALDTVRIAGNNAVHPGVLDLEDNKTNAANLFNMINIIVENQIVQPKKIEEFYSSLPELALDGIEKRDKNN